MSDLFGLITFWSFVIAAYSVFPPKIRAKVRLFVGLDFTFVVFILSSLLAIFINIAYIYSLCANPQVCKSLYDLSSVILYTILAIYGFVALYEINRTKVNRKNIHEFKSSAELLYRKGLSLKKSQEGWDVLIDILTENTDYIFKIATTKEVLRKLWFGFWIRFIMPKDKIVFTFLERKNPKKKTKKSRYKKLLGRITGNPTLEKIRRKLFAIATGGQVNTFYPTLPSSKSTKAAEVILEEYILDEHLLKLSTDYKPEYILSILTQAIKTGYKNEEIIEKCINPLLENKKSILYREIYSFFPSNSVGENNSENSQLLSIFFDTNKVDKKFIDETHIYGGVVNFMYEHLASFRGNKKNDPYNDANRDVDPRISSDNPLMVSIQFYDWIVKTALELDIEWHMWLMNLANWTKTITENMTTTGRNWTDRREFPTIYFLALYEIVDKLTGWVDFVERNSSIDVKAIKGIADNGNILGKTVETIALYFKYVSNAKLPEYYKVYLGDIIWRRYFMLMDTKRKELHPYGELLIEKMIENLTMYGSEFDVEQYKTMLSSLYRFDVIGLHSSNDFKLANAAKEKMKEVAKAYIGPQLSYTPKYEELSKKSKELLSETADIRSDGIYIASYFRQEKVFSLEDLGIEKIDYS